jgi:large subunit ribosomal protein L21
MMYAVVEIQGSQFKVTKDQKLFVNRIDAKEGSKVSFDKVLLVDDGKNVQVGKPNLSGTAVEAKIIAHLKDDKVIVFKKKRRKGYKVKNGHRQSITEIVIQGINDKKSSPKKDSSSDKTTAAKKKVAAKKTTTAKKKVAVKKTTAVKK